MKLLNVKNEYYCPEIVGHIYKLLNEDFDCFPAHFCLKFFQFLTKIAHAFSFYKI